VLIPPTIFCIFALSESFMPQLSPFTLRKERREKREERSEGREVQGKGRERRREERGGRSVYRL
jgi:hypothetical protein